VLHPSSCFLLVRPPPSPPLFPYTTLFRSMKPVAQPRSAGLGLLTEGHAFPLADLEPQGKIVPKSAESVLFGTNISRLAQDRWMRSEEHTSELQSLRHLVCRLLLEKKKKNK